MSPSLVRLGGIAALVAAPLGILGDLYHFFMDDRSRVLGDAFFKAHGLLLMTAFLLLIIALPAFLFYRRDILSPLGRIALPLGLIGTTLVLGDIWAETVVVPGIVASQPQLVEEDISGYHLAAVIAAFAIFALGWLLVGITSFRARNFPRPALIVLCIGAVVAFLPLPGVYILLLVGAAWMGWSIVQSKMVQS